MAESGRIFPRQLLDLDQIMRDARCRWLRPGEVCEILCNYKMFQLMSNPPARPPAGSLFLFDRKVLRHFRKDGHRWRKKKDGKTIKEAHEKLKSGSMEVLHCYYAHGEDNENFQRRCYWMLDGKLEHIVLVHYRDLKEVEAPISRSAPGLTHSGSISSYPTAQMSPMSVSCNVDQDGLTMSQEIHNLESGEDFTSSQSEAVHGPICLSTSSPRQEGMDLSSNSSSFLRNKMHGWGRNKHETQNKHVESVAQDVTTISDGIFFNTNAQVSHSSLESEDQVEGTKSEPAVSDSCVGALNKLDSFGRWMDKEIGKDCEGSFMVSGSENYWNSVTTESDDKEVSSLSPQIQLDLDSLGPSLSQEQLFSITDFSPDWAFSGVDTKVIIAGKFLGDKKPIEWACMFGEFEVPAEVLTDNAIRCHAPPHAPGRVPFYVTGSNRQACSEIREFEYLKKPILENTKAVSGEDEVRLQVRLAKLLSLSVGSNLSNCSLKDCSKCKLIDSIYSRRNCGENHLKSFMVDLPLSMGHQTSAKDLLIENLLKDKFFEWLFYAAHDDGKGPLVLDDKGQGVVHLAAALGYHWAIGPVIAAGVSPDFRDAHGRTGLHWAAYYGREETVIVLSRLHASPSAVDDPSQACPGAQKAADLSANRGHKGIAAYLAEADLNSQLSALTLKVNATNDVTADGNGGKAIEMENTVVFADRIVDESVSIKGPLAALTKAAHAAAFIQAAFRTRSFKQRHLNSSNDSISEDSVNLVALGYMNRVQGMSNFNDYLHSAAFKIQHKYRGWRSRKNFLKIHNRLVQIQAHARGHQLRQRYKKVVWSVSMMEKAILRWRRRRPGLRGFRTDILAEDATTKDNADEYEFLHIGQKQKYSGVETALARVQSMVHYPEAREQYMRLASSYISQATVE